MSFLASKDFWKDAAERMVRTAAQAAVAMLIADQTGVLDTDWGQVGSVSGMAAIVAVLTALAAGKVGSEDSASLMK